MKNEFLILNFSLLICETGSRLSTRLDRDVKEREEHLQGRRDFRLVDYLPPKRSRQFTRSNKKSQ